MGEDELVARAAEASQSHTLEAMLDLQVSKAHLHFLAIIAGLLKRRSAFLVSGHSRALLR